MRHANKNETNRSIKKKLQIMRNIVHAVFPLISVRALIKYFQKLHGRLLEGALI